MFSKKNLLVGLFLLLSGLSHPLFATDTLLYRSPFEARLVQETINRKNADFFALFLSINSDSASYARHVVTLNNFYTHLDQKLSSAKAGKQKAKVIFKEVHAWFFRQYEENVLLNSIFRDGIYNCLTASMLYALVLERYEIPYAIKEKPTHIYLVAFPGAENILFETTNPRGLYIPDDRTKRDYVSGLVAMKLTTQDYVNSIGVSQAFNEFYYNNQNITLQQLAGLQYFNQAVAAQQNKDIDGAIKSIRKAELLYPCTKNQYFKRGLIGEALANSEFESLKDIGYLAEHANGASEVQDKKRVLGTFGEMLETKLLKNGEQEFITQAYTILETNITDEKLRSDIRYSYELAMTYWLHMKSADRIEVLQHAEEAYKINPNDVRLQDLILQVIIRKSEHLLERGQAIEVFQGFADTFPFLKTHDKFRQAMVYQYAVKAHELFSKNLPTEGYKYLALIEQGMQELHGDAISLNQIAMVYAEAGACHFRKKEYAKARSILRKGLGYVPGHPELKERLRIVEAGEARPY